MVVLALGAGALLAPSAAPAAARVKTYLHDDRFVEKPIGRTLVVGVTWNEAVRGDFEREVALRMRDRGVDAVAAENSIPFTLLSNREVLDGAIADLDLNAVIFVRYQPSRGTAGEQSPTQESMYDYQRVAFESPETPGYLGSGDRLRLETRLYAAVDGALVWSMISETTSGGAPTSAIGSLAKLIAKRLARDGLI